MRKSSGTLSIGVLLLVFLISPVSAYNAEELSISINPDGSAEIEGTYELGWGEFIAYSLIPEKETLAENVIGKMLGKDIIVNTITAREAKITVPSFARVSLNDSVKAGVKAGVNAGVYTYITPEFPYNKVGEYMDRTLGSYPILRSFDCSADMIAPGKTIVTFPDGYSVTYSKPYPNGLVPSTTH